MTGGTPRRGLMVFSHGKNSGPRSRKISLLRPLAAEHGWLTEAPDYAGGDAPARISRLEAVIESRPTQRTALVGSSMGGVVSVFAAQRRPIDGLFLMAPAVYWPGYEDFDHAVSTNLIHIVHGWRDDVVAADAVIRFARDHRATLHLVDDDHRLAACGPILERLFEDFLERLEDASGE